MKQRKLFFRRPVGDPQAPLTIQRLRRLLASPEATIFLASLWITAVCNAGYWTLLASANRSGTSPDYLLLASFLALTIGLISMVLLVLAFGFATRLVLSVALIVAAAAGYFTSNYGTLFDGDMIQNVVETNRSEALELVTAPMLIFVAAAGLVPTILVWKKRIEKRRIPQAFLSRGVAMAIALLLIATPLFLDQKEIVSVVRNQNELRHMIAPLNVLSGGLSRLKQRLRKSVPFRHIGLDATRNGVSDGSRKPVLNVLIVGETARAANFSLGDYARNTNPLLEQRSDIIFRTMTSCGTATAMSLPCMFSRQGHSDFVPRKSANEDNLLDIVSRSGYNVIWIDNGNSCKGVCKRIENYDVHRMKSLSACPTSECYDGVLVEELQEVIANVTTDTFVILHQLGSHGPAYFKRYPDEFRNFLPDCRSADFVSCERREIVNAYDNTITYTDHLISSAIDLLSMNSSKFDTALVYVSDHGESLGEHNMYLHGMPYSLAPTEQTEVPFVAWLSDGLKDSLGLSSNCNIPSGSGGVSHDNVFHTELGLLGISTSLYSREMDLVASCRSNATNLRTDAAHLGSEPTSG